MFGTSFTCVAQIFAYEANGCLEAVLLRLTQLPFSFQFLFYLLIYLFIYLFIYLSIFCFQAIKQGRVYVLRYELCDDLPKEKDLTDSDPNRTMWETFSPIALFASAENIQTKTNNLVPVAIQMDHTPG